MCVSSISQICPAHTLVVNAAPTNLYITFVILFVGEDMMMW